MRITIIGFFLALLVAFAMAAAPQKAIVVTFEDPSTPQSTVDAAMQAVRDAGGVITHEYSMAIVRGWGSMWLTNGRSLQRFRSEGFRESD